VQQLAIERLQLEQTTAERKKFVDSLRYPEMNSRHNQVRGNHQDTFEWLFPTERASSMDDSDDESDDNSDDTPIFLAHSFEEWLGSSGNSMYWVSGKSGSGKSTLVKYILGSAHTKIYLGTWHPGDILFVSHFFWRPGTFMEKSFKGFLCSASSQILFQAGQGVQDKCRLRSPSSRGPPESVSDWSIEELKDTFIWLLDELSQHTFLLIDGLDEMDPPSDLGDLLDFMYELASRPRLKICAASRPETLLERFFQERLSPHLRSHELTRLDIAHYISTTIQTPSVWQWGRIPPMSSFDTSRPNTTAADVCSFSDLVSRIVAKSEGVFLWAVLVVKEINLMVQQGSVSEDIVSLVSRVPGDLQKLYQDRFHSDDRSGRSHRARIYLDAMLAVTAWRQEAGVEFFGTMAFALAHDPLLTSEIMSGATTSTSHLEESVKRSHDMVVADIATCCVGLVETRSSGVTSDSRPCRPQKDARDREIYFIHRMVYDFLCESTTIERSGQPLFRLRCRLLRAFIASARPCVPHNSNCFVVKVLIVWFEMYGSAGNQSAETNSLFLEAMKCLRPTFTCLPIDVGVMLASRVQRKGRSAAQPVVDILCNVVHHSDFEDDWRISLLGDIWWLSQFQPLVSLLVRSCADRKSPITPHNQLRGLHHSESLEMNRTLNVANLAIYRALLTAHDVLSRTHLVHTLRDIGTLLPFMADSAQPTHVAFRVGPLGGVELLHPIVDRIERFASYLRFSTSTRLLIQALVDKVDALRKGMAPQEQETETGRDLMS
jgi:energy-coupling factor transporter ATP-binding protein EcfA2